MDVSEGIVEKLVNENIDVVFGIPGTQTLPLNSAIESRDDISYIMARHETAVTHQAWGYAESSTGMAASLVVPGPGDMNSMNGLKNALNDNTPMIQLVAETDPSLRGGDAIHETPPDTFDNVVKDNVTVQTPESTLVELERLITLAQAHPKGPVRLGIPKNFLEMDVNLATNCNFQQKAEWSLDDEDLRRVLQLIDESRKPLIVAGGGVRSADAGDELVEVAEQLNAPVVTSVKGKGVISEDHPLSAGVLGGGASSKLFGCIKESDLALAVGTDFDAVSTKGWSYEMPKTLIHITLEPGDIGNGYSPEVGLVMDAKAALGSILDRFDGQKEGNGKDRAFEVREHDRRKVQSLIESDTYSTTSPGVLQTIRETIPRDSIVTADAGGSRVWALTSFPAYGIRQYINPGSWATMGTAVPSAIGAKIANPDTPVVALVGDGGLMMCLHELHTLSDEEIPVIVIALNNSDYAIISEGAARKHSVSKGSYGWEGSPIDFVEVSDGLSLTANRAHSKDELQKLLRSAIENDRPELIEIATDPREPQAGVFMRESTS